MRSLFRTRVGYFRGAAVDSRPAGRPAALDFPRNALPALLKIPPAPEFRRCCAEMHSGRRAAVLSHRYARMYIDMHTRVYVYIRTYVCMYVCILRAIFVPAL